MKKAMQKLMEEVKQLIPEVPSATFQFDFNRQQAEYYLKQNPQVPFIIRLSSVKKYFAFDAMNAKGGFSHLLIAPPNEKNPEFMLYKYRDGIKTKYCSLQYYISSYWKQHKQQEQNWEQFKIQQQDSEKKIAVLSIQSLDGQKIALAADQLKSFATDKPDLKKLGDGHTGFALATVLEAPFVVLRSEENREEQNVILANHIGNNGLLVLTGHGGPEGNEIIGTYLHSFSAEELMFQKQIERGPVDIVNSVLAAGLKSGDKITILLAICYGAVYTINNSFAHKLALEFAKHGVSTTIIASDKAVRRFGYGVIKEDILKFNHEIGMAAEDIYVFTTEVQSPTDAPEITIYKPNETIQLTKTGIQFVNLTPPTAPVHQTPVTTDNKDKLRPICTIKEIIESFKGADSAGLHTNHGQRQECSSEINGTGHTSELTSAPQINADIKKAHLILDTLYSKSQSFNEALFFSKPQPQKPVDDLNTSNTATL